MGLLCGEVRWRLEAEWGLYGWRPLFLIHVLCTPLMMGLLSQPPLDLHSSATLIKPPFTQKPRESRKREAEFEKEREVMGEWKGEKDGNRKYGEKKRWLQTKREGDKPKRVLEE